MCAGTTRANLEVSLSMREKLYDPARQCLVYIERAATEEFWDERWEALAQQTFSNPPHFRAFVKMTKKYLPLRARVLEGGCGLGVVVNALDAAGFNAWGVDFAPKVVEQIKQHWPHLKVSGGDVRDLKFEDEYFDGYWSLGVIEHFPAGYDAIAKEMHRVLKQGGHLFLTFPSFNGLRKALAAAGKYRKITEKPEKYPDFYQFALDPLLVAKKFASLGFSLMEIKGMASFGGLAEESILFTKLEKILHKIHPKFGFATSRMMDVSIGRYLGHSALLILRKD